MRASPLHWPSPSMTQSTPQTPASHKDLLLTPSYAHLVWSERSSVCFDIISTYLSVLLLLSCRSQRNTNGAQMGQTVKVAPVYELVGTKCLDCCSSLKWAHLLNQQCEIVTAYLSDLCSVCSAWHQSSLNIPKVSLFWAHVHHLCIGQRAVGS